MGHLRAGTAAAPTRARSAKVESDFASNRAPLRVSREHELEGLDISQHGKALQ